MELHSFKNEMASLLKKFDNSSQPELRKIEADIYKRLTDFFLAGESFYFTMNHHKMDFEFVSKEVKTVLGYEPDEFSIPFAIQIIHPEDRPYFLRMGETLFSFIEQTGFEKYLNFKMRYDIRYRKKDGSYCRVLYQSIIIDHDGLGGILRTFGTYTDISYLKDSGPPTLSFIGMNGMPSYINVPLKNKMLSVSKDDISYRERQVLTLLAEGKASKEIGLILGISKGTVDRHRKNMLHKKGLANTSELVSKAIRQGWI